MAVSVAVVFCVVNCAFAQDPQYGYGIQSPYTYTGAHESINLGTGNLTVQVPLLKLPGRNGHDYSLVLTYNSQIWSGFEGIPPQGNPQYAWQNVGTSSFGQTSLLYGWSESSVATLYFDAVNVGTIGNPPNQETVTCFENYRIKWGDGHIVPYPHLVTNCTAGTNWPETHTGDAISQTFCAPSRSVLEVQDSGTPTLYMENGDVMYFAGPSGLASTLEDSNGNQMTLSGTGSGITKDTLGRAVSSPGPGTGTTFKYSYNDSNGNQQTIQMIYTSTTFTPTFPTWQNAAQPGKQTWNLLTTVIAANGDRWDLQYDSFGELSKITYPTGGYTTYGYAFIGTGLGSCGGPGCPSGGTTSYPKRQLVSTQLCRDTNTRANGGNCSSSLLDPPTSISPSTTSSSFGTNLTSTVVDPLGNQTVYTFGGPNGGQETERQIYQGSSTLLRTVNTTQTCDGPTKQTITLNDMSGTPLVSETTWTRGTPLTAYGGQSANLTQKVEYDYGSGSPPTTPLRTTNYTYLETNSVNSVDYTALPHYITNRKASETVLNGSGATVAQTTYQYDSYGGGITASGAIQHDSNLGTGNSIRGNVTEISRLLNPGNTLLNTINTYDDAGNILTTKDPNGNVTSFSYTDNFASGSPSGATKAYVTQVTLPTTNSVSHITRKQYFFNTGLTAASCGENFPSGTTCTNTSSFPQPDYATTTYDALGRPLVSTVGDGGQTSISYSDDQSSPPAQFSTTTSTLITSSLSKTSTALMDGIGEVIQTQLTSDPDGTDFVDTTYDGLGHVSTVSNPHRSSSLPTDGITKHAYDALGRNATVTGQPSAITQPDNSVVNITYSGNTVTTTDEASKFRKSVSDALGTL